VLYFRMETLTVALLSGMFSGGAGLGGTRYSVDAEAMVLRIL
jgi:hypothetical protein